MQLHRIRNSARAIAVLLASACMLARGQTEARFAGRPFVRVARANTADPTFGFVQGFGRSQVVGGEVVFPVLGNGFRCVGLARGRGGPWSILARAGTTTSTGAALSAFHDGIAEGTVDPRASSFVFAAGGTEADGLYFSDGGTPRLLLPSGTVLPSSGGLVANRLGEPHWVDGKLAVIAWHQAADGVRFRGIYRVIDGTLSTMADTGSPLPGVVGVPDTFSSQLGFDGVVAAFWASRGEFGAVQGMFRHPAPGGTPVEVVSTGGSIPGGGTILGFRSPPVVDRGTVWFFAYDGARVGYLLREDAGVVSVVAKDGDPAPEGGVLAGIGDTGLEASEGRVVFGARTASGTGVYEVEGTSLRPVVPGGGVVASVRPTSVALVDLAGDTLLLQLAGPGVQPVSLVANLARPQVPVILSGPVGATVPAGATIRLEADVLGDPPLTYLWTGPTGQVIRGTEAILTIPNAAAAHAGYYSLQVTNEAGSVRGASVLVNVEAPPEILVGPESTAVEAGDSLVLRVIALGGLPLGYAWWKDGQALDAAVGARSALSVASARASDAGEYHVVVTNAFGTVRSETVRVTVR
ncbi:MAG: immunoglobulin domain-containing protein, partial [Verrucomicrobiales bacterium]|nr:immunoglobulin domain-containing protein [Verrucomicrobiales bacterium]